MEKPVTYQRFPDIKSARELTDLLERYSFTFEVEDNSSAISESMIGSSPTNKIAVKIRQQDFASLGSLIEEELSLHLNEVEEDYYLLHFTNEELTEVVLKQDEWSKFDYLLARKILKENGIDISEKFLEATKKQRIKELSVKEKSPVMWIVIGYFAALLGGLLGIIIGYQLLTSKKTLPNGQRVSNFSDKDKQHGLAILIIAVGMFCVTIYLSANKQFHLFD
ncbi:MAG: hypothetical protein IAF38_07325 [Bacteroidia bacterium]|nr:hypothetical protein [Bacteroidia bacterium]